ncbi:D-alanine-D-alanine ligase [Anaerobranca californiensis DSM 14826]|uniref:D-alanine-D-alanine ligase n=1 Tax=Anaerobranca californiensis DSM 14826 TaxID=1120989 RepID=A0A1M6P0K3_9FIRM|nr:hypothetical protein [Anaerobranca californiensis]SHK01519.1 D-alanine-D-alanine ligase [Anaerobranca californiensis DSM 14826]
MKKKILFLFNAVEDSKRVGVYGECASFNAVGTIHNALLKSGNDVVPLNLMNPKQLTEEITKNHYDLAFVIAEGYLDIPETLYDGTGSQLIRQVLKTHNLPFTHSDVQCMEYCRNKDYTYERLKESKILVPSYYVVDPDGDILAQLRDIEKSMEFPLFVKPTGGGNSIGIDESSIVHNFEQLDLKITNLITQLGNILILVETYLSGREYTIGVMGNNEPYVLPIVGFPLTYKVRSFASKKTEHTQRDSFQILDFNDSRFYALQELAINTYKSVGAEDIIRLEVREDANKNLYVIDVNGTPAITQGASLAFMMNYLGLEHHHLICSILYFALQKNNIPVNIELLKIMEEVFHVLAPYKQKLSDSQQAV